jgi:hypothetical protein
MMRSDFERRAAEMRTKNLGQRQFRSIPPSRSVFAPPRVDVRPVKVHLRDFITNADLGQLSPQLAQIKKLGTLETDRDGLVSLKAAGVQISVSPEILLRTIKVYDAVLREVAKRGWPIQTNEGSCLKVVICEEALELAVAEETDPIPGIQVRPGERRPRRPAGSLTINISDSFRSAKVSDKRGTSVESKLPQFFEKAIGFAHEVHTQNEERAASKREYELKEKRRREIEQRIERLNRNMAAWQRAEQIRAYAQAMADGLSKEGPIAPESDAAKWLKWARRHADSIDPMHGPITITPQEFWEWDLVLHNE